MNTARGTLVDDEALIAALRSGRLFAAGLDVFAGEPNIHPGYRELPNCFLLPHLGSATIETRDAMGFRALDNLDAFFAGRACSGRPELNQASLVLPATALAAPGTLALIVGATSRPALADCAGAQAFVQDAADRSLAVLNAPGADDGQRLDGMNQLLFELADVPLIARLVLGRHWRAASEPQRTAYLDAFRVYALDSLAFRFARLGGGVGFQLLGRCVMEGDDALIPTEVTLPNRPDPDPDRVAGQGSQGHIPPDRRRGRGRKPGGEQPQ